MARSSTSSAICVRVTTTGFAAARSSGLDFALSRLAVWLDGPWWVAQAADSSRAVITVTRPDQCIILFFYFYGDTSRLVKAVRLHCQQTAACPAKGKRQIALRV